MKVSVIQIRNNDDDVVLVSAAVHGQVQVFGAAVFI